MTKPTAKPFSVTLWGSHPDAGNDDAWTGDDFDNYFDAFYAATHWRQHFARQHVQSVAFVELTGSDELGDVYQLIANPDFVADRADDDSDWRSERAMQAGMAFGVDGWNDEMGF